MAREIGWMIWSKPGWGSLSVTWASTGCVLPATLHAMESWKPPQVQPVSKMCTPGHVTESGYSAAERDVGHLLLEAAVPANTAEFSPGRLIQAVAT